MYKWSNIEIEKDDSEILKINSIEDSFETLPRNIIQIRELITRLEICHFKYKEHIEYIKNSILELSPNIIPEDIGKCHIRNGETVCTNENSGRSLLGQKYVWALKKWLNPHFLTQNINYDVEFNKKIFELLGEKNSLKKNLVRLLIARLTWDWQTIKSLNNENNITGFKEKIIRVDICHYNFPENIINILKGIGLNKPDKEFEGCGSFNDEIKITVAKEFISICQLLKSFINEKTDNINKQYKIWLTASLLKTLKEQIKLEISIEDMLVLQN